MSETFPTKTEIAAIVTSIVAASEARVLAALKAPAPAPSPDPMPGGGEPERTCSFGCGPNMKQYRIDPLSSSPEVLRLGTPLLVRAICKGWDPRLEPFAIVGPDGEGLVVEFSDLNGAVLCDAVYHCTRGDLQPRRIYCRTAIDERERYVEFAVAPAQYGVVQPKRDVEAARPIDPPAPGGWARPTEAQYLAGDRLPVCRSAADVGLAKERIKLGRLPWINSLAEGPTAVVTFAELMAGYDRIEKLLALSKEDYYAGWWHVHEIELDLVCAIAILGKQAGLPAWDDPYAGGSAGTTTPYGRADKLAGFTLGQWLAGAFQSGTGGSPSGA